MHWQLNKKHYSQFVKCTLFAAQGKWKLSCSFGQSNDIYENCINSQLLSYCRPPPGQIYPCHSYNISKYFQPWSQEHKTKYFFFLLRIKIQCHFIKINNLTIQVLSKPSLILNWFSWKTEFDNFLTWKVVINS